MSYASGLVTSVETTSSSRRKGLCMQLLRILGSVVALMLLAGCFAGRTDLIDAGQLQIEPAPSGMAAIPAPAVWDDHGKLSVIGWINFKGPSHHYDPGHVHVVVRSPSGEELARKQVRLSESDTGSRFTRQHRGTYSAEFPQLPPAGSKVQVWHCHDKHANDG